MVAYNSFLFYALPGIINKKLDLCVNKIITTENKLNISTIPVAYIKMQMTNATFLQIHDGT